MNVTIVREPLVLATLVEQIRRDECGAVVSFIGVVRDRDPSGRAVFGLTYEAYEKPALAEMEAIVAEAEARFGPCTIAVAHRIGELAIGEASVAIAVGAPHRGAAFDACEYAIDELKKRVPIWKKEAYLDGDSHWVGNLEQSP